MAKYTVPTYDKIEGEWIVDTPYGRETGDLEYAASEFAHTGQIFPYSTEPANDDYHEHDHCFKGVIKDVLRHPDTFSIKGFEEYYSRQERELLSAI